LWRWGLSMVLSHSLGLNWEFRERKVVVDVLRGKSAALSLEAVGREKDEAGCQGHINVM